VDDAAGDEAAVLPEPADEGAASEDMQEEEFDLGPCPALDCTEPDEGVTPVHVPCKDNGDCISGWCVETPDGKVCTGTCSDSTSCDPGWLCAQVASDPDVVWACVHPAPAVCMPCQTSADCKTKFTSVPMECVPIGGSFWCLRGCADAECPPDSTCSDVAVGRALIKACLPGGGKCGCTAMGEGVSGKCETGGELGTCSGKFSCKDKAPTACDAPAPAAESCNGKDDDCDGATDEGIDATTCDITNAYGTCKGKVACLS
jgi:hypothetical protein